MLEGKGIYIWQVHQCEGGDPKRITQRALEAGLTHVLVKIADGSRAYNSATAAPVIDALKQAGIQAWGWQYVYGLDPFGEASIAARRSNELEVDGFIVNAEVEYYGRYSQATAYMDSLRARVGNLPLALSSFRFPDYHRQLPWTEFLSKCDFNMPQVYWVRSDNPPEQLDRSVNQFSRIYPVLPIIPTGSAYAEHGWRASGSEVRRFLDHARKTNIPAANFWSWDYAGGPSGRDLWDAIAGFDWPVAKASADLGERWLNALQQRDWDKLVQLYHPAALLLSPRGSQRGAPAVRRYYEDLLNVTLPSAQVQIDTRVTQNETRLIVWRAFDPSTGKAVPRGVDTFVVRDGQILYQNTQYEIV
ncbi:MAG: nuclear transport factor 2 family protein [Chloroflexi bacterium]|nr:nuclear transport factor 2 family protein [Chloroflexota bacterium]